MPEPGETPKRTAVKKAVKAVRKPVKKTVKKPVKKAVRKPAGKVVKKPARKAVKKPAPPREDIVVVGHGPLAAFITRMVNSAWKMKRKYRARQIAGHVEGTRRKVARTSKTVRWMLAVPADAVASVLASLGPSLMKGDVVLHTAPGLGNDVFNGLKGIDGGVFFPLGHTSAKAQAYWSSPLRAVPWVCDGAKRARSFASLLSRANYGILVTASAEQQTRLKAAMGAFGLCFAELLRALMVEVTESVSGLSEKTRKTVAYRLTNSLPHRVNQNGIDALVSAASAGVDLAAVREAFSEDSALVRGLPVIKG